MVMRKWGKSLSISEQTFSQFGASLIGLVMFIALFYNFSSLSKYHRISLRYIGIMIALVGFVFPYLRQESTYMVAYIFLIVTLVPFTLWSQSLLKRQEISHSSTANASEPPIDFNGIDSAVHGPIRLGVLCALKTDGELDFTTLKKRLSATDGALGIHLQKLETIGYITCHKEFVGRRPRSTYQIAPKGSKALSNYLASMQRLIDSFE